MTTHDFSREAFVTIDGKRQKYPVCRFFPCKAFRSDDGKAMDCSDPTLVLDDTCEHAPTDSDQSSSSVGTKRTRDQQSPATTTTKRNPNVSRGRLTLEPMVEDFLLSCIERPIYTERAARVIESGSHAWIGDHTLFPEVHTAKKSHDPYAILWNRCAFDAIVSIRFLAMALNSHLAEDADDGMAAVASAAAAAPDIRDEVNPKVDVPWTNIFTPSIATDRVAPAAAVEHSFCTQVIALGRKARIHRTLAHARAFHTAESEVKVRDPNDPSKFIDWLRYSDCADAIDAVVDTNNVNKTAKTLTIDNVKERIDFVIGIHMTAAGFDPTYSNRELWQAVDEADAANREQIRKLRADDAKAAKDAAKEAKDAAAEQAKLRTLTAALLQRRPPAAAASGAGAAASLGTPAATTGTATSTDTPRDAKRGRGKRGGPPTRHPDSLPDRAAVLALAANQRTKPMARRYGLCMKCRQPGHLAVACTNEEVTVAADG